MVTNNERLLTRLRETLEQIASQEAVTLVSTTKHTEGDGQKASIDTTSTLAVPTTATTMAPDRHFSLIQADNYKLSSTAHAMSQQNDISASTPCATLSDFVAIENGKQ